MSSAAVETPHVRGVDMKLEVVVIPVSDVDRAKGFYGRIGWRLDIDRSAGEDFRLVQFTPPGSCCSVHFGKNVTSAAPGSAKAFLIVTDIEAARDHLVAAGVEVGEFFHDGPEGRGSGPASRASFPPLTRLIQRSRRQRLAPAGDHDPGPVACQTWRDFLRLRKRPGERASACGGRSRRAREANRPTR
jgi:catechol 2,3-dioxygenase-like lactoylglutathione lyase family enzyme